MRHRSINLESHCHSQYSPDSGLKTADIARQCRKYGIDGIIICDHDVCGITKKDEKLFRDNGIKLYKAIEFTTKEGAHVIGVSGRIQEIQRERGFYTLHQVICVLKQMGAVIIIPHPRHGTGILGNSSVASSDADFALRSADFIEWYNYRYGRTKDAESILKHYTNLAALAGSDAHARKDAAAVYNQITVSASGGLASAKNRKIRHVIRLKRTRAYWIIRRVQVSACYQALLNLFPARVRRDIKKAVFCR